MFVISSIAVRGGGGSSSSSRTDKLCNAQPWPPLQRLGRPVGDDGKGNNGEGDVTAAAADRCSASPQRFNDLNRLAQAHVICQHAAAAAGEQPAHPLHTYNLVKLERGG